MEHHRNLLYEQTTLIYLLDAALKENITLALHALAILKKLLASMDI